MDMDGQKKEKPQVKYNKKSIKIINTLIILFTFFLRSRYARGIMRPVRKKA